MAKGFALTEDYKKAGLIANWLIIYNDPEKGESKLKKAEELCVYNGMEPGQFQKILDGEFQNMSFRELLAINRIIKRKRKVPLKPSKEKKNASND